MRIHHRKTILSFLSSHLRSHNIGNNHQRTGNQKQRSSNLSAIYNVVKLFATHFDNLSNITATSKDTIARVNDFVNKTVSRLINPGPINKSPNQAAEKLPLIPESTRKNDFFTTLVYHTPLLSLRGAERRGPLRQRSEASNLILNRFLVSLGMTIMFLLYTFPAYASHCENNPDPNIPLGQYCEKATNTRWQDMPCIYTEQHEVIAQCAADEDCVQLPPDSSGYKFTECQTRSSGTSPGSTTNFGPDAAGLAQIEAMFEQVISFIVPLAFVALFVVLVWAGIKFLTSGGDPKALEAARNTVTWALLGILFLAIAWLVLQLVAAFTGIDALKTFDVGKLCTDKNLAICVPKSLPAPTP